MRESSLQHWSRFQLSASTGQDAHAPRPMTNDEPDPIPEPEDPPVGHDWLPCFTFSSKRLLFVFVAYAIALGAYSYSGWEYVAYGLIPGTTMGLVVLLYRRQDLGLLLSVGFGALVGAWPCGSIFAAGARRIQNIPETSLTGITLGAFIGGALAAYEYRRLTSKS